MLARPSEGEWVWVEIRVLLYIFAKYRTGAGGGMFSAPGRRAILAIDVVSWTREAPNLTYCPNEGARPRE